MAARPSRRTPSGPAGRRARTALFVVAIATSAFLLFSLELLTGRLVLPTFGGSAAVWTTALAFFTAVLFLGYLYAHLVAARLGSRRGGIVQLIIGCVATAALVLAPRDVGSLRIQGLPEAINVLLVLSLLAGIPGLLLATTTPVLSSWFAEGGEDPWWLYGASNAASLTALLAYPFVIEPNVPLSFQRLLLTIGLALFVTVLAVIVVRAPSRARGIGSAPSVSLPRVEPIGFWRAVRWLVVAFIPAGLLSATTAFLATDLVSAPLIWIGPLAIYLASLVVAFSARGRRVLGVVEWLIPAAVTLLWVPFIVRSGWPVIGLLLIIFISYGILATALHGRLALDRPEKQHLTLFYLVLSAGGLLATAFVALVAPLIFNQIYEYPALLVAGIAALGCLKGPDRTRRGGETARLVLNAFGRLAPLSVIGLLVVLVVAHDEPTTARAVAGFVAAGGVLVALSTRPAILAAGTALIIVALSALSAPADLAVRVRTFFSVIEVTNGPDALERTEYSGTTLHGVQFLDARSREPTTYYVRSGPLGDAFEDLRARTNAASIAVVGLGTGTTAAYSQVGDRFSFYEIDQAAVEIARDPALFTFLSDAPVPIRIVVGDARLSLAAEPRASVDLLVLDAFASDAVPAHLLTREAIADYRRVLRPGGIAIFHLSNRYYDLAPAVASTAESIGLAALSLGYQPGPADETRLAARAAQYLVVGAAADVARFADLGWAKEARPGPVLTDDFFDTLRLLRPDAL